jgi:hypothetical protein
MSSPGRPPIERRCRTSAWRKKAHALNAAAAGTAALLEQPAQVPGQPERIDYPTEITQWRAFADQSAHMAQRWQQRPARSVAQGGAAPSVPGPYGCASILW